MPGRKPNELDMSSRKIEKLPRRSASRSSDLEQGVLDLTVERQRDVDGVGMGVLSDGTPFLTGRGLARLLDIENLHVRTISQEWNDDPQKPRIAGIKRILERHGVTAAQAHVEVMDGEKPIHAFPEVVCLAILEYYAFDAVKTREKARDNYRLLAGKALRDFIYSQVGYDPSGRYKDRFAKWHERLALNHQSAPKGYFSVFNEADTVIYELIQAGAEIGEKFVVDISIGKVWGKYWTDESLGDEHGERKRYPHRYPSDHPQANSNPQDAWCYPLSALGAYREWLQDIYIEGGKFASYLKGQVRKGGLTPSAAQLAVESMTPKQIADRSA